MAALVAAKSAFDSSDLKTAKAQLQWAAEHGNEDIQAIARLRLSAVLLDEKAYDEGLKLLAGSFLPQFASAVADRRGDILVAQNKLEDARKAYIAALAAMDKADPSRKLVEVKLESIGGTLPTEVHPQGFQRRIMGERTPGDPNKETGADDIVLWMPDSINKLEAALLEQRIQIARARRMLDDESA